jgi:hypothetical protein
MSKLIQPDPDEVVEKANDLNAPLMPANEEAGFRRLTEEEKENFTGSLDMESLPNLFGLGTTDVESNSMSDIDIIQEKTTTHPLPQVKPLIHRIWPQAVVGLGLGVTSVWICFLGYGLLRLS